jgi:hypothetical protein
LWVNPFQGEHGATSHRQQGRRSFFPKYLLSAVKPVVSCLMPNMQGGRWVASLPSTWREMGRLFGGGVQQFQHSCPTAFVGCSVCPAHF